MPAHVARFDDKPRPAVIVLEGVFGFDAEIQRITIRSRRGYTGLAIDYLRGGRQAACSTRKDVCEDVAAARDWLNNSRTCSTERSPTVGIRVRRHGGVLGSSLRGSPARSCSTVRASRARSRAPTASPRHEIEKVRVPLLLVFGGHDEQIGPTEIATIRDRLTAQHAPFELEVYPEVGHSFFREDLDDRDAPDRRRLGPRAILLASQPRLSD